MTVEYCTAEDVTNYYRGGQFRTDADVALKEDSGSSDANADRVHLTASNAGKFYAGAQVRVYDTANPIGEVGTISSIKFDGDDSYLDLAADLTNQYDVTSTAMVQLRSFFNKDSKPDIISVERLINDAEDWFDEQTHHAWREVTETNEYHDRPYHRSSIWPGTRIPLNHRKIKNLTSGTDKIEVYEGTDTARLWTDWVATKTEGRDNDYWVDYEDGIIYLISWFHFHQTSAVRVTYRFGETSVPNDIRRCVAMMVAKQLLEQEQHLNNMPAETGTGHTYQLDPRISKYQREINAIINHHTEIIAYHE